MTNVGKMVRYGSERSQNIATKGENPETSIFSFCHNVFERLSLQCC